MKKRASFKKVLCLLAAVAMVVSNLVFKTEVNAADSYEISSVEITFDEPKVGDDIAAFLKNKGNAKVPAGAHYQIYDFNVITGLWPEEEHLTSGKFENKTYMIRFTIKFDAGYRNTGNIMYNGLLINGYLATTYSFASGNILQDIGLEFSPGKQNINKINIITPEPVVGETLPKYAVIESDPADATSGSIGLKWFKGDKDLTLEEALKAMSDDTLTEVADGEKCEWGKYYYVTLDGSKGDFSYNDKYALKVKKGGNLINGKEYDGPGFIIIVKFGPTKYKYNVSFETSGGSKVAAQVVTEGGKAAKPADPTKSGYKFAGWFTSSDYKTPFDFGKVITSDTVIYAKWEVSYKNEWVNGRWYDEFGNCSYEGILSWKQDSKGWWVEDSKGWYPQSQWQKIDGKWYYFCADGYMDYSEYREGCWLGADGAWDENYSGGHWMSDSTGWWYEDNSGWYPVSKWLWIDGACYYFESTGYMATNKYVDGCWVGSDGAWK